MSAIKGVSGFSQIDFAKIEQQLKELSLNTEQKDGNVDKKNFSKTEFIDLLEKGMGEINLASRQAERMSMDLASGKTSNIHETMLAVTKAELGFSMMVQMRNKMIEAYQEVMRMQV